MNDPIHAILVMGKYGSGKTDFLDFLKKRLASESSIRVPIEVSSDRIFIEEEVIRDVWTPGAKDPGRVGQFSTLYKPDAEPGFREFGVIDGTLHRYAHYAMIKSIRYRDHQALQVLEIGIGPDVEITKDRQPLRQSGDHFLEIFHDEHVLRNILVVEMEASYAIRSKRNSERPNPVPEDIFVVAARDEGEFWKTSHGLGDRHILFHNETNDSQVFLQRAEEIVSTNILPHIRGEGPKITLEGGRQGPFHFER